MWREPAYRDQLKKNPSRDVQREYNRLLNRYNERARSLIADVGLSDFVDTAVVRPSSKRYCVFCPGHQLNFTTVSAI